MTKTDYIVVIALIGAVLTLALSVKNNLARLERNYPASTTTVCRMV
jgi:hypothetical protein